MTEQNCYRGSDSKEMLHHAPGSRTRFATQIYVWYDWKDVERLVSNFLSNTLQMFWIVLTVWIFFSGYYSVNTHRVRETMRVVLPPLDDLSDVGEYIRQECEDKTTYRLEKSTDRSNFFPHICIRWHDLYFSFFNGTFNTTYYFYITVFKRSAELKSLPFTEFTGLATMEYDIININQLQKFEKNK